MEEILIEEGAKKEFLKNILERKEALKNSIKFLTYALYKEKKHLWRFIKKEFPEIVGNKGKFYGSIDHDDETDVVKIEVYESEAEKINDFLENLKPE